MPLPISYVAPPKPRLTRRDAADGLFFILGLLGAGALLIVAGAGLSTFPDAPWWSMVLPVVVLAVFWPVCLGQSELARRREWPYLFPLETAAVLLVVALAYSWGARRVDSRFWGILGGMAAVLAVYVRGRIEADARAESLDRSLGVLTAYVRAKRWRSAASRPPL